MKVLNFRDNLWASRKIIWSSDFPTAILDSRRKENNTYKVLRERNCEPRVYIQQNWSSGITKISITNLSTCKSSEDCFFECFLRNVLENKLPIIRMIMKERNSDLWWILMSLGQLAWWAPVNFMFLEQKTQVLQWSHW